MIVGSHANAYHSKAQEIGQRNWQWWEIVKSKEEGKGLIGVKIDPKNDSPEPLMGSNAKWAMSFNVEAILKAIKEA